MSEKINIKMMKGKMYRRGGVLLPYVTSAGNVF
jgi:hypothetical protein